VSDDTDKGAEIVTLPGIERRDLVGVEVPVARILDAARTKGLSLMVIVGRDRSGKLYVAGTSPDVDKVAGILSSAIHFLNSGTYESP
jgi:hypothetical protein